MSLLCASSHNPGPENTRMREGAYDIPSSNHTYKRSTAFGGQGNSYTGVENVVLLCHPFDFFFSS